MTPFQAFDYAGVAVFAVTGALVAARLRQDVVTFVFFATVTGIGGGTLRDLLLGAPVFWVSQQGYLIVCAAAAIAVWTLGAHRWPPSVLLWLDAIGLAAYAAFGAAKATGLGAPPVVAIVMGVMTATFGGVMRDLFGGQPSVFLHREIYVTAALVAATIFVILTAFGIGVEIASAAAFVLGFALRAGAILRGWSLPGYGKQPS